MQGRGSRLVWLPVLQGLRFVHVAAGAMPWCFVLWRAATCLAARCLWQSDRLGPQFRIGICKTLRNVGFFGRWVSRRICRTLLNCCFVGRIWLSTPRLPILIYISRSFDFTGGLWKYRALSNGSACLGLRICCRTVPGKGGCFGFFSASIDRSSRISTCSPRSLLLCATM